MKKLKKMIALLILGVFVFAVAVPAQAATFSDVKGDASDEIYRLNSLGIINGYPDGTFKPDNNITRAEFAVIAMSAAGNADSAEFLKNTATGFKDVKPGDWFTGWVNLAASLGYISGYPDGSFRPNANITYAEALTILCRILGYTDKLPGEWPTEYLIKAAELGITDDVVFAASTPATRSNVAILTSQTLDQNLVNWDKDIDDFAFRKDADDNVFTLLAYNFDGAVYDREDYRITAWEVDADGQFVITITGTVDPFNEDDNDGFTRDLTLAKNVVVKGSVIPFIPAHQINFIYDSVAKKVLYVKQVSTILSSDDVEADGAKLKVDGTSYKFADNVVFNGYAHDASVYNDCYYVYLGADNKIYMVAKATSGNPKVIKEIGSDKKLEYMSSGSVDLDQDDLVILRDYRYATVDDLKPNDIVYVEEDAHEVDVYIDARSAWKTGSFDAAIDADHDGEFDQVKIGGKKYDLDVNMMLSTDDGDNWTDLSGTDTSFFDDLYGVEVKFGLDKKKDVAFITCDEDGESSVKYGIVQKVLDADLDGYVTSIKLLTEAGDFVTFDVDESGLEYGVDIDARDAVSYKLNADGDIEDMTVLAMNSSITDGSNNLNKLYISGSWYYTTSDTVILNGRPAEDEAAKESANDLESAAEDQTIACWIKTDGNKLKHVLISDDIGATADDMAMVIDSYYYDGDTWVSVDIRGAVSDLEVDTGSVAPEEDVLFQYSMSGSEIKLAATVDATVAFDVYGLVTDIDETNNAFEVYGIWFEIDADSYIYDMTGSDPVYIDGIDGLTENDAVFVIEVSGDDGRKGMVDVILIVDEDDYSACDFEAGGSAI